MYVISEKVKSTEENRLMDESVILALRKNPKHGDGEWKEMPMDDY